MKNNKLRTLFVCCAAALLACTAAQAQRWSPSPTNPTSGQTLDPSFCYDPGSGNIYVENSGPNRRNDTAADGSFLGDDYPLVSVLISFNGTLMTGIDLPTASPDGIDDPTPVLPGFANGIAWGAPRFFNNQLQLVGQPVNTPGGALAISEDPTALMNIGPGFTAADFGTAQIETGFSFDPAAAGSTTFSVGDGFDSGVFHVGGCLANNFEDGISSTASTDDFWAMFGGDALLEELNDTAMYPEGATLFVPTDAAIAAAATAGRSWSLNDLIVIDSRSGNPSGVIVSDTPGYNEADLNSLVAGGPQTVTALSGNDFDLEDGSILYGGATVIETDFNVDNGWIHVIDAIPVPEPGAMTLLAMALAGLVGMRRRS